MFRSAAIAMLFLGAEAIQMKHDVPTASPMLADTAEVTTLAESSTSIETERPDPKKMAQNKSSHKNSKRPVPEHMAQADQKQKAKEKKERPEHLAQTKTKAKMHGPLPKHLAETKAKAQEEGEKMKPQAFAQQGGNRVHGAPSTSMAQKGHGPPSNSFAQNGRGMNKQLAQQDNGRREDHKMLAQTHGKA